MSVVMSIVLEECLLDGQLGRGRVECTWRVVGAALLLRVEPATMLPGQHLENVVVVADQLDQDRE